MFPSPSHSYSSQYNSPSPNKPKVGLAVVCRCSHAVTSVQCLLQKRGSYSCSPNKWSFPGGRLDKPGDLEEDGAVGTRRELEEEAGGGSPLGLPPLIHIECCKSGKMKQTLYHVFVVDTSREKDWEQWYPKPKLRQTTEVVDLNASDLHIQGHVFPCVDGYCWVDMSVLIEHCYGPRSPPEDSDLHHGLVRWVKVYGEHFLKTLIARSPKISGRRLSNSSMPPTNGFSANSTSLRPRGPKTEPAHGKSKRFGVQRPALHTVVLPVHHHPGQPVVMFPYPPSNHLAPVNDSHNTVPLIQPTPGLLQQSPLLPHSPAMPGLIQHHPAFMHLNSTETIQFPHTSSPTAFISEVAEGVSSMSPHMRPGLVSEVSSTPVIMSTGQALPPGNTAQHMTGLEGHPLSVLGPGHINQAPALANHEQALLPTGGAHLPQFGDKMVVSNAVPVRAADSGPLLPNPPIVPALPIAPQNHIQVAQQNARKETICKHFLSGTTACPYGEKCWFAHPEPIAQAPTHRFGDKAATTTVYGTTPALPAPAPTAQWINNQNLMMSGVPQFVMASPPQSPLNSSVVTIPNANLGALPQPRANYPLLANHQQQPVILVRPQRPETQYQGASPYSMMVNQQFPPIPPVVNPVLRFDLLADLRIQDGNGYPVMKISQQVSRADQLLVSFGPLVHTYKILFGGNRGSSQSFLLNDERNFSEMVSCVHASKQQQGLVVVGTETGSISLWDARRVGGHLTEVHRNIIHHQSLPKPDEGICSLVHFATSINSAVVVAGSRGGVLSWYISQPPQKTFSLLYSDFKQHVRSSIISIQVISGHLISGDASGRVVVWSMQTQSPIPQSTFYAHTVSLCDLHVVDGSLFITIGTGQVSSEDGVGSRSSPGGQPEGTITSGLENLTEDISQLSMTNPSLTGSPAISTTGINNSQETNKFSINLWQLATPPKLVSTWSEEGVVNSTSFHCHTPPGNMFLAVGLLGGLVKIYNSPSFKIASELQFPEMKGTECSHITINHSRDVPRLNSSYYRNPFRDLILTTVWSDGRIMVCQVAKRIND